MAKAFVFDFGNVLGTFDYMKACIRLAEYCKNAPEDIYDFAIRGPSNIERETGRLKPFEFFEIMSEKFRFDADFSFEEFCCIWGDIFTQNKAIESVVQLLSQKFPIFVLSNSEELHWRYIKQLPVIQKHFSKPEQQILSFRVGVRKPDRKIFEEAIKRSEFPPEEIIYIDDILEYVESFRGMGGQGIYYNCVGRIR